MFSIKNIPYVIWSIKLFVALLYYNQIYQDQKEKRNLG
jgi:hypothetical protein